MIYALDGIAPQIHPTAWVAPTAVLVGNVIIGPRGANCTSGHKAMLHGCIIEDGCLIGMGATLLNGATIGTGSLVGACALVTEGKIIPPGSLVMGSPGKVVRELDDAARARLLKSAAGYQANAQRFAVGMKPVA